MEDTVTVLERIYFDDENKATKWYKKIGDEPWEQVDCSPYPDGRPPFVRFNPDKEWEKNFGSL